MAERIDSLRTYFAAADRELDVVQFARAMLATQRGTVQRQIVQLGFAPRDLVGCMAVQLPDPHAEDAIASTAPVVAYVNAGEWKARCECGGVEYVDLEQPLFQCCSCWNARVDHRWRPVVVPAQRAAIERLLLRRDRVVDRAFRPDRGETLVQLARENRKHGLDWHVKEAA